MIDWILHNVAPSIILLVTFMCCFFVALAFVSFAHDSKNMFFDGTVSKTKWIRLCTKQKTKDNRIQERLKAYEFCKDQYERVIK